MDDPRQAMTIAIGCAVIYGALLGAGLTLLILAVLRVI